MSYPTRDISFIDEFYVQRNLLSYNPNFQICATYNLELSVEQIFSALTLLLQRHLQWSLQAYPKENQEKGKKTLYEFRPIKEYKLSDILQFKSSKEISFENLLTSLVHKKFEISRERPLWGLILYESKTLIFYADHLLGDGTSYLNFQLEFSKFLNNPADKLPFKFNDGIDSTIYKYSSSKVSEICPANTSIINYSPSWGYMTSALCKALIPSVYDVYLKFKPKTVFEQLSGDKMMVEHSTNVEKIEYWLSILNIPTEKVEKLIRIARNHQVKLTSLLYIICLLALLPITDDNDTSAVIPTNIRRLIDTDKAKQLCSSFSDKFGLFMGAVLIDLPSLNKFKQDDETKSINWEVVKHVQNILAKGFDSSYESLSMLKFVTSEDYLRESMENPRTTTYEISNLGSIKDDPDNKFKIVDMVFNQPLGSGGNCFSCNVLGTNIGGVNLSLTCTKALNEEYSKVYVDGVRHWIDLVLTEY